MSRVTSVTLSDQSEKLLAEVLAAPGAPSMAAIINDAIALYHERVTSNVIRRPIYTEAFIRSGPEEPGAFEVGYLPTDSAGGDWLRRATDKEVIEPGRTLYVPVGVWYKGVIDYREVPVASRSKLLQHEPRDFAEAALVVTPKINIL